MECIYTTVTVDVAAVQLNIYPWTPGISRFRLQQRPCRANSNPQPQFQSYGKLANRQTDNKIRCGRVGLCLIGARLQHRDAAAEDSRTRGRQSQVTRTEPASETAFASGPARGTRIGSPTRLPVTRTTSSASARHAGPRRSLPARRADVTIHAPGARADAAEPGHHVLGELKLPGRRPGPGTVSGAEMSVRDADLPIMMLLAASPSSPGSDRGMSRGSGSGGCKPRPMPLHLESGRGLQGSLVLVVLRLGFGIRVKHLHLHA